MHKEVMSCAKIKIGYRWAIPPAELSRLLTSATLYVGDAEGQKWKVVQNLPIDLSSLLHER